MAGVTHRISEIFELLDQLPDTHDNSDDLNTDATSHSDSDLDATRQLVQQNKNIVQGKDEYDWLKPVFNYAQACLDY